MLIELKNELSRHVVKAIGQKANLNVSVAEFSFRDIFLGINLSLALSLKIHPQRGSTLNHKLIQFEMMGECSLEKSR